MIEVEFPHRGKDSPRRAGYAVFEKLHGYQLTEIYRSRKDIQKMFPKLPNTCEIRSVKMDMLEKYAEVGGNK